MSAPRVLVVGSVNMDLVLRAARFPGEGETVVGDDIATIPGGKGANQAVAAARLGGQVAFVGRVGADAWGGVLRVSLADAGVETTWMRTDPERTTGAAVIVVEPDGENRIVVVPGANDAVSARDVDAALEASTWDVILLQLEIPLATVTHAIRRGREQGARVVLDAGPPRDVEPELLRGLDVLSPNETETEALSGIRVVDLASAREAARVLRERSGAQRVVLKLGDQGALWDEGTGAHHVPGFAVRAIDTTAAGDSFTAALALELATGASLDDSVRVANAAGALATTRHGAQPSLPSRDEVDALLREQRRA